jgi:adenylate cyclase
MRAKLRVTPASADPFDLVIGNTATIGRTSGNTVCLSASPRVSRQHALIRCHDGYQYQLIDLGSRNGTFVNDQRVITPVTLSDGARIRVVDTTIIFEQTDEDLDSGNIEATTAGSAGGAGAATQRVALLVCDVRGFTSIAERIPSPEVAQQLGAWFREAGNLVTKSGGTIDKFIGDAMLAYWSPSGVAEVDCAGTLKISHKLLSLADTLHWPNGDPFQVGVALHYGLVTCSNVGLDAQRDATIIGDAVNTVFRLETVMKELNQLLVFSHDFRERLAGDGNFKDLGERTLKGKRQLVRIYTVPSL